MFNKPKLINYYRLKDIIEHIKNKGGLSDFCDTEELDETQLEIMGDFACAVTFLVANKLLTQREGLKLLEKAPMPKAGCSLDKIEIEI